MKQLTFEKTSRIKNYFMLVDEDSALFDIFEDKLYAENRCHFACITHDKPDSYDNKICSANKVRKLAVLVFENGISNKRILKDYPCATIYTFRINEDLRLLFLCDINGKRIYEFQDIFTNNKDFRLDLFGCSNYGKHERFYPNRIKQYILDDGITTYGLFYEHFGACISKYSDLISLLIKEYTKDSSKS